MPRRQEIKELDEHRLYRLLRQIIRNQETYMAFIEDATAALNAQTEAINSLAARIPGPSTPPDPATIVPVTDQQTVLSGIADNTSKINALLT